MPFNFKAFLFLIKWNSTDSRNLHIFFCTVYVFSYNRCLLPYWSRTQQKDLSIKLLSVYRGL